MSEIVEEDDKTFLKIEIPKVNYDIHPKFGQYIFELNNKKYIVDVSIQIIENNQIVGLNDSEIKQSSLNDSEIKQSSSFEFFTDEEEGNADDSNDSKCMKIIFNKNN